MLSPLSLNQTALEALAKLPGGKHRVSDAERLRCDLADEGRVEERGGVRYWKSNGAVVPTHVYADAAVHCPTVQAAAYKASLDAFFKAARSAPKRRPSAEERFEALAAHGPGVELVDVITGGRFRT